MYNGKVFEGCPQCGRLNEENTLLTPGIEGKGDNKIEPIELKESGPSPEAIHEERRFRAAVEFTARLIGGYKPYNPNMDESPAQYIVRARSEIIGLSILFADALLAALEKGEKDER